MSNNWELHDARSLRQQQIVERVLQEDAVCSAPLPADPLAVLDGLEVFPARIVGVQNQERAVSGQLVVVDAHKRVCQNPAACKEPNFITRRRFF
jgi:hypothetical protein